MDYKFITLSEQVYLLPRYVCFPLDYIKWSKFGPSNLLMTIAHETVRTRHWNCISEYQAIVWGSLLVCTWSHPKILLWKTWDEVYKIGSKRLKKNYFLMHLAKLLIYHVAKYSRCLIFFYNVLSYQFSHMMVISQVRIFFNLSRFYSTYNNQKWQAKNKFINQWIPTFKSIHWLMNINTTSV